MKGVIELNKIIKEEIKKTAHKLRADDLFSNDDELAKLTEEVRERIIAESIKLKQIDEDDRVLRF